MPPPYCYDYPRPAVTVDLAVFALQNAEVRVLLIRRKHDPFAGKWALPGGFLEIDEPIEAGARRELQEETGLESSGPISFLGVYGEPGRDPRGRTISMAYATVVCGLSTEIVGQDDAAEAAWRLARGTGSLAFDHDTMLKDAVDWLQRGVKKENLGLGLLPEDFDESDVRGLFTALFDTASGASLWIRRMKKTGQIATRIGSGRLYHAVKPPVNDREKS